MKRSRVRSTGQPGGGQPGCDRHHEQRSIREPEELGETQCAFLLTGICLPGKTRSDMIQSVAASAANRGWTWQEFHQVMLRRELKGTAKIIERLDDNGPEAARAYLNRSWNKALRFIEQNPAISNRDEVQQMIRSIRQTIEHRLRPGRTWETDLLVADYHLQIAQGLGSLTYAASERRIADKLNLARLTVRTAHARLMHAGLLLRLPAYGKGTAKWKILTHGVAAAGQPSDPHTNSDPVIIIHTSCESYWINQHSTDGPQTSEPQNTPAHPDHDVWHHRGLGKGAWRTWKALSDCTGMTDVLLARELSCRPRTIRERLKRLAGVGLVLRSDGLWYRDTVDFDAVADRLGTLGRLAARKRKHQAEREYYERTKSRVDSRNGEIVSTQPDFDVFDPGPAESERSPTSQEIAAAQFIRAIAGCPAEQFIELRCIDPTTRRAKRTFHAPAEDNLPKDIAGANRNGLHCYFGVSPRSETGEGDLEHCAGLRALYVDIDFKDTPRKQAQMLIDQFPLTPSVVVNSGGGFHVYWLLSEPILFPVGLDKARKLLRLLTSRLSGDMGVAEPARVLRVPGTYNHKYDPPRLASVVSSNLSLRYAVQEFEDLAIMNAARRTA